jgi:hypothetical protein
MLYGIATLLFAEQTIYALAGEAVQASCPACNMLPCLQQHGSTRQQAALCSNSSEHHQVTALLEQLLNMAAGCSDKTSSLRRATQYQSTPATCFKLLLSTREHWFAFKAGLKASTRIVIHRTSSPAAQQWLVSLDALRAVSNHSILQRTMRHTSASPSFGLRERSFATAPQYGCRCCCCCCCMLGTGSRPVCTAASQNHTVTVLAEAAVLPGHEAVQPGR